MLVTALHKWSTNCSIIEVLFNEMPSNLNVFRFVMLNWTMCNVMTTFLSQYSFMDSVHSNVKSINNNFIHRSSHMP